MKKQTQSFLATRNFESAWRVYQQWRAFEAQQNRQDEVQFAGCRINGRNCWEVQLTQDLHDTYVAQMLSNSRSFV